MQVCGWRFLQRYNLKKHMVTHSKFNGIMVSGGPEVAVERCSVVQ
jgi:hypothetical protein